MTRYLWVAFLAFFLTACGGSGVPQQEDPALSHQGSSNGLLWGLGGFLLGRATAPSAAPAAAPQVVQQQVVNRTVIVQRPVVPTTTPAVKPPVPTTAPKVAPAPTPTVTSKPSFSGPSSYGRTTSSFSYSRPSFSSGGRR